MDKYITLEYEFGDRHWDYEVDVNNCLDQLYKAIEKEYKNESKEFIIGIETFIDDLKENGNLALKKLLALHYKEDLEEIFEENAKDDFWDTCGAEIEAGLKAEYEEEEYERNKERREL